MPVARQIAASERASFPPLAPEFDVGRISEARLHWIAGIIEGEGCFFYNKGFTIVVAMTDLDVIERIRDWVGSGRIYGPYPRPDGRKPMNQWVLRHQEARELAAAIFPLLGRRRQLKLSEIFQGKP